jgi:branched-subunit amino acid transport protein
MDREATLLTILGMGLVTYLPRLLPVWFLSSRALPRSVVAWLRHVPVAVLAAMLAPSLFVRGGTLELGFENLFLWAAIPTFFVAWKRHNLFAPVVAGMLIVAVARLLLAL